MSRLALRRLPPIAIEVAAQPATASAAGAAVAVNHPPRRRGRANFAQEEEEDGVYSCSSNEGARLRVGGGGLMNGEGEEGMRAEEPPEVDTAFGCGDAAPA